LKFDMGQTPAYIFGLNWFSAVLGQEPVRISSAPLARRACARSGRSAQGESTKKGTSRVDIRKNGTSRVDMRRNDLQGVGRPIPSNTLVDKVYRRLEEMIVTLELEPGALLSESELGKRLGVSRTPVGAALQRLAREGLVNILPRRGIVVTDVDVGQQLRVLEIRREISRFVARVGAERARAEQRAAMRAVAEEFQRAVRENSQEVLVSADKDFHNLLAACTHNPFACDAMDPLDSLARRFWFAHQSDRSDFAATAMFHSRIALAIAGEDPAAAEEASDAFSDYLEHFARGTIDFP